VFRLLVILELRDAYHIRVLYADVINQSYYTVN